MTDAEDFSWTYGNAADAAGKKATQNWQRSIRDR
jgi:hypothetical protein